MIPKGFYIKARQIDDSEIAHKPPHFREIWDYLLRSATHEDYKTKAGYMLKKGQLYTSTAMIKEALHWFVGYRKETYSTSQCENAMKWLSHAGMIAGAKTGRGIVVTILKYDFYQDLKSYESRSESRSEIAPHAGHMPDDIYKQAQDNTHNNNTPLPPTGEKKPSKKKPTTEAPESLEPSESLKTFAQSKNISETGLLEIIEACLTWHKSKGNLRADWQATVRTWIGKMKPWEIEQRYAQQVERPQPPRYVPAERLQRSQEELEAIAEHAQKAKEQAAAAAKKRELLERARS